MQRQSVEGLFKSNDVLVLLLACGFGIIIGIACIWLSGLVVLGVLAVFLLAYAILKRPEIALIGILIATSSIVFEDQLPTVSVGISLHIPDFLLLGAFGIFALRWLVEPKFKIVHTPLDWPVLLFFGITLFWTFNAIFHSTVEVEPARRGIRILAYYLTFFIVTNMVRDRRQLNFLLNGIFLLATVVAAIMVAQFVLGNSVALLPVRVEELNTQGVEYSDVTRILTPGISIILVSFITTFCLLIIEKFSSSGWLKFLQFGLFGMAFLFTFLRSYWTALIVILALLAFILRGPDRQKFITWVVVVCSVVMILLFASNSRDSAVAGVLGASADRLGTVFTIETFQGQDGSLNYRKIENGYAISQIISHPLTGLGIGAFYRPLHPVLDWDGSSDGRRHIHNGHLLIFLQSGLFGYLSLMWLSLAFLVRGFTHWHSIPNHRMRGIVLGFTLVYLAVVLAAVVNSSFMQWYWTPVFGIIIGVNEVIFKIYKEEEPVV